jgi:hypothetical protein
MAVIKKTLFAKNLDKYAVLVNDTQSDSKYFKITELPDTFTGGKNAFLIAGSEYLVPDTKIQIELKDSAGNIIYHEPGEGMISSSINGETFVTEYYEGVSKVVAIYVYPDTAYGPCTLTILGELSEYQDTNGVTLPVPLDWENKYNVKWQKQIDVNPSLANTTKIRFYKRPTVSITELLEPIYRIESGSKVSSGINQSFAEIKLSQLETFAGDVKRVKVFRTSLGDISDFSLIQDILVESKELLTTFTLSGSVIGNTGIFTSETLKTFWNTGSLNTELTSSRIESGVKLNGSGYFTYTQSLDIKSANTYELNLDAFYSASTSSNLGIYLSYVSQSTTFTSSLATLVGTQPTKNLLDTVIPFKIDRNYPSASLYFSQSQGEWHLGNISLRLSQDTAFSPDEISFITPMPTVIGNEDFNFKFEFFDVNNNYVPVFVTQSANFTGGSNTITKLLTFESDRTAFRFSTGSFANPSNQSVRFKTIKTNFTGSVTYASSAFDVGGNYIEPSAYAGTYPGTFVSQNDNGALLNISSFSGSVASVLVGSIVYTASCEGFQEFETIYRFEDGDNAPGVFVTANTNQFIYKATDLSLNPTGQVITIEAKRKNLASATTPLTVNSGSGKPPLTLVSTNATNGVDTYTIAGSSYPFSTSETSYFISGSDQFGNEFSDAIKISPVKILDGLSATLTNDNATLSALSNGFVASASFAFTSGSINVKVGNETITFDDDNDSVRANNTFAITNLSGTGCTPNGGNNSNPSINGYGITNLTADSGSLDITISYKDGAGDTTSIVKTATYTKNKKAAPVLAISSTPKDQSVTAKSTGAQIDSFANATIVVKETYNGATTTLPVTLTATRVDTGGSLTVNNTTGVVTLSNQTLAVGVNSTTVNISAVVTDSEGTSRTLTDTLSLSKVKKAAPVVVATLSKDGQSITKTNTGVYGTPATFTISVNEGGADYTYSTGGAVNTYQISLTGGTGTTTITPTTPTTDAGTTVAITITYVNSEGTTGTLTKEHKVNVTINGTNGTNGDPGAPGSTGVTGPGVVHTGVWTSGRTYQFSDGLTDGTGRRDTVLWSSTGNAPYNTYYATTRGHLSATGNVINGAPHQPSQTAWTSLGAQDFFVAAKIGIFEDSFVQKTLNIGTNSNGALSSANITLAGGSAYPYISIGQSSTAGEQGYNVNGIFIGVVNVSDSPVYRLSLKSASNSLLWNGTSLTINGGGTFSGDISAATGTFTGGVSGTGYSLNNSGLSLTNAGSSISLGNGVTLNSSGLSGAGFSLTTTGVVANAGTIAGWSITETALSKSNGTYTISLNSTDTAYYITRNSTNQVKVKISPAITIPAITVADFDFVNFTYASATRLTVTGDSSQSETRTLTATSGRGDTDAGIGNAGTGIIWLQYPTEEIWVDADGVNGLTLLQFLATIQVSGGTINNDDGVRAKYQLTLVAEKYASYTHAANRTNLIQTYRSTIVENNLVKLAGNTFSYADYSYGIFGGGFQVDSNQNWFYVYLEQYVQCATTNGVPEEDSALVYMNDFGSTVKVQFGRVDNGFSQLAPAGLQVYTGVRNYMNASVSAISGENFFEVKGKSQFLSGLAVNGTFSASTKQFQITHPLNENKWLYHTAIEGPQADLIYRGKLNLINGEGSSNIDISSRLTNGTFNSLTRNPQLFLQNNDSFDRIKGKIENGNVYVVSENQNSSASVDWTVIAERCDTEVLTGGTYGGDGKYKTEKWKKEFRDSLMITGSV